jgi:hypothetical protein
MSIPTLAPITLYCRKTTWWVKYTFCKRFFTAGPICFDDIQNDRSFYTYSHTLRVKKLFKAFFVFFSIYELMYNRLLYNVMSNVKPLRKCDIFKFLPKSALLAANVQFTKVAL